MIIKKDKTCGKRLAQGYGMGKMLNISYKRKLSPETTVLVVKNPADLGSKWEIYERLTSI